MSSVKTSFTKSFIVAAILSAAIVAAIFLFVGRKDVPIVDTISLDTVDAYRDTNDKLRAQVVQKVISHNSKIVDSLKSVVRSSGHISGITVAEVKVETTFVDKPVYIDSAYELHRRDPWLDLSVRLKRDTGIFAISLSDSLTITRIDKRGLFSKRSIIDISHSSPYFSTSRAVSYIIDEKYPIVTIGPSVMIGYDGKIRMLVGISAQIPIIKIRK